MERSRVVVPKFTVGDDVVVPWEANRFPYNLALSVHGKRTASPTVWR